MKQSLRHQKIVELVKQKGYLSTEELVALFGVSPQTIRRDLNELAETNFIRRHHGGAASPSTAENSDYHDRKHFFSQEKKLNEYKKLVDSAISIAANNYMLQLSENSSKENNIIYVVDENSKPIDLDSIKSKLPLKTIDINNKNNRKTLKKGLKILRVRPLLQGNKITITIINFLVKYKGKEYHYFNGGGSSVFFEYSCQEEKWILTKVEHIGI